MSEPIRTNVDPTNPGQFFACCGLLELASRIHRDAQARFENGQFVLTADVPSVLECLFRCKVEADSAANAVDDEESDGSDSEPDDNAHRGRTYPMYLGEPFNLRLDWWTSLDAQKQKLKTWTAGQRVTDLLLGYYKGKEKKYIPSMREHFETAVKRFPNDWLRETLPIKTPMSFSYDSRLSRNNALDQGYVAKGILAFSPAIEVLTLIGLQRFRPLTIKTWSNNLYFTWKEMVPIEIANVVALGLIPAYTDQCFEFPIKPRDSEGRFKLFGHAQRKRSTYV